MTDFNKCLYLNGEKDNASSMLKKCIHGSDDLAWPCISREIFDRTILNYNTTRASGDNIQDNVVNEGNVVNEDQLLFEDPHVEGFTNMGEKYIPDGRLQDGYFKCPKTGKVTQVCMNCKYNQSTYGKSKEFNEGDPCFPNNGVYNGITNDGYTDCTCGSRGQYCNNNYAGGSKRSRYAGGDNFDAQGGMMIDNIYIMNVGEFGELGTLASY